MRHQSFWWTARCMTNMSNRWAHEMWQLRARKWWLKGRTSWHDWHGLKQKKKTKQTDFLSTSISWSCPSLAIGMFASLQYLYPKFDSHCLHRWFRTNDLLLNWIVSSCCFHSFSANIASAVALTTWWIHISNGQRPWDDQTCAPAGVARVHHGKQKCHAGRDLRDPAGA